jgi:hypothetical protein
MMYSIIKKFIFIFTLCSISFSQTGNDFLRDYPFDKKINEMTINEQGFAISYMSMTEGYIGGNLHTLNILDNTDPELNLNLRVCDMPNDQIIRIIKKWCDNNPTKTNMGFKKIIFFALKPLAPESECLNLVGSD